MKTMANRLVEAINAVYDRFVDGAGAPTLPAPVQSDLEAILWNLAGADVDLPVADTGLEGALANLAEHADEIGGGGDLTTATLTITAGSYEVDWNVPCCYEENELEGAAGLETSPACIYGAVYVDAGETVAFKLPLYKGSLVVKNDWADTATFTGDIDSESLDGYLVITGDCAISGDLK